MTTEQKNRDFIQLYRDHIDDVARLARENPRAYDLFMILIKHMDGSNALCVSYNALTELLKVSDSTLKRAIRYLKDNGWLCVLKSGTSNVYIINPDVVWTSYGNQKQYCKFQANVLLSSSENAEYLNNPKATNHFKTIDNEFIKSVQQKSVKFDQENNLPGQIELEDVI